MLLPYFGVDENEDDRQILNIEDQDTEGLLWLLSEARKEFDIYNPPTQKLRCAYVEKMVMSERRTVFRNRCQEPCVVAQQFCPKHLGKCKIKSIVLL